ncbi:hypothetical protein QYF61_016248 [Mycteria americana]|uniref:Uncharacterized protein n=1 Tax=Mycteria americana TaxID=33587 RepID=A0AAN7MAK7_MYCAM|nr:hypothetical protein QYF61_016248 [Mycteria americana]
MPPTEDQIGGLQDGVALAGVIRAWGARSRGSTTAVAKQIPSGKRKAFWVGLAQCFGSKVLLLERLHGKGT